MKTTLLKIFALVLFAYTMSFAQQVKLVKDINSSGNNGSSSPQETVALGTLVVFRGYDPITGWELWVSNGSSAGTTLLKDILPGGGSSYPNNLTKTASNLAYFQAYTEATGYELWKTDGTAAGTVLVKDINPGTGDSYPSGFTLFNGFVYFQAYEPATGTELWKTDGTTAGTTLVVDIAPGSEGSGPYGFAAIGTSSLVFSAYTVANGYEFYTYNGSILSPKDLEPGANSSYPNQFVASSTRAYFSAYTAANGYELWTTDGTVAGTTLVDIVVGTGSSNPYYLTVVGSTVFFYASHPTYGYELWKYSSGAAPTVPVVDLVVGAGSSYPYYLTASGSGLFFVSYDDDGTGNAMRYTTGTSITLVTGTANSYPEEMTSYGSSVIFFRNYDATNGYELWKATSATATLVKDIVTGSGSSYPYSFAYTGTLFFTANDGVSGYELWSSDGTAPNTNMVKDVNTATDSQFSFRADTGTGFLASAFDGLNGAELWKTDVTPAAETGVTSIVADINPGAGYSYPNYMGTIGTTYFFYAYHPTYGYELWKTNGVTGATVIDIVVGAGSSYPSNGVVVSGFLYFNAYDPVYGYELWRTDGTTTTLVKDIYPGVNSSYPTLLTAVGSVFYFRANDGTNGLELWKSDGTSVGTSMLKNISTAGSSSPNYLTNLSGALYFSANDGVNGTELWTSDGSNGGTLAVKDINATGSSSPALLTIFNSAIYFRAWDGIDGFELWKSNGTSAGTVRVKDIEPGTGSSSPVELTVSGTKLFFRAYTSSNGYELWQSDGTDAGTTLVKDINTGTFSSSPSNLSNINGTLYFSASDATGQGLFKSNGSSSGTIRATSTGLAYASPGKAYYYNGRILFTGNTASLGNEPLTIMAEPLNQPTALNFTGRTSTSISASFTAAAGSPAAPSGYIVLRKTGSAPTDLPVDGTPYTIGATVGTSTVVATGATTSFTDTFTAATSPPVYYYAIFSYNNDGTANIYRPTSPLQGNTTPFALEPTNQPTALTASAITTTSFTVSFTAATGSPTGYLVLRKAGNVAPAEVPVDGTAYTTTFGTSTVAYVGPATTFPQTGLTAGTAYSYSVYSYNGSATTLNYLQTAPLTGTISTLVAEPTAQPTGLVFSGNTPTSISGSFTAASPVPTGGYIVVRNTTATIAAPVDGTAYTAGATLTGTNTVVFAGTGTTFTDNFALTAGTTYFYAVYSFNGSGGTINYLTTTPLTGNSATPVVEPTAQPTAFSTSLVTTTSFTVSYAAAAGSPTGYIVLRKAGSVAPTEVPIDGTAYTAGAALETSTIVFVGVATTFNQTGLTAATAYSYAIYSYNGAATTLNYLTTSPLTGTISTLVAEPTAQPTSIAFSGNTPTSIGGSFTAASPAPTGGYIVIRNTTATIASPVDGTAYTAGAALSGGNTVVFVGTGTAFTDNFALTAGTTYFYAVYSFNGTAGTINYLTTTPLTGNSTTPVVEPTTQPTAFVVTALTTTSFTVSFTAAAGSPNGYIALRKAGATAPTDLPVDGVEYTLGATIGTSTVAFLGDFQTTTFNQTGLTAGSSYSYAIFSANGSTGTWNYLTTIPLTGTASTIAAEPTAQPTSLVFSNVALTSLTGTFTAASGPPSGYIAIRKKDSAPTGIPADGTAYVAGNVLGDAVVAYFGPAATFNDSGLTSESIYHYQVFSFNGSGPTINYLTASPLSNSQLLLGTPPVITNETAATIGSPTTQLKVVASVVENESSLPAGSVKIEHRSISAGGAFSTPENMTLTAGKWEFTLPVASNGELGAEYKITATNSQGLSANVTGKATLTYSGTGMIIPYNSFGTEQTNYRIISIPLVLDPKTVAAVLEDDLGALKKDVWRIFNYSGTSNVEMNASSTIEPGKGYWLIAKTSASLDTGPGATVPTTQSFSVPLVSGWNLIGNPYTFNVLWSDVLTASGLPATTKIVTYDGAYNLTGDNKLDKFEGGFVNVLSASDLKFPVTKNPAAGRESGTQTAQRKNSIDQSDWEVIINLKNGGKILGMGGVGMNENANLREDIYDEFTVPRFFEYVEMNHNKRFINSAYAKDIVPTQQNHEWDFTVETNLIGNTNLEWDNSYFGNNEAWLVLWDVEEQRAVDMKKENSYSLNGKKSKTFRAFYGNKEFIDGKTAVSSLLVHSLSPNPTNGQTKIGFSLPGTEEATVQVRVLNMMGQAVAAVFDGSLPGGYNEVTWSGKDNLETKPAGGIYLVEIRALNQTRVAKLIIN